MVSIMLPFSCSRWWTYWHAIWKVRQVCTKKLTCFSLLILSLNALEALKVTHVEHCHGTAGHFVPLNSFNILLHERFLS